MSYIRVFTTSDILMILWVEIENRSTAISSKLSLLYMYFHCILHVLLFIRLQLHSIVPSIQLSQCISGAALHNSRPYLALTFALIFWTICIRGQPLMIWGWRKFSKRFFSPRTPSVYFFLETGECLQSFFFDFLRHPLIINGRPLSRNKWIHVDAEYREHVACNWISASKISSWGCKITPVWVSVSEPCHGWTIWHTDPKEYVASITGVYKNNGAVSCVGKWDPRKGYMGSYTPSNRGFWFAENMGHGIRADINRDCNIFFGVCITQDLLDL